jgi:hypothetical protein
MPADLRDQAPERYERPADFDETVCWHLPATNAEPWPRSPCLKCHETQASFIARPRPSGMATMSREVVRLSNR